MKARLIKLSDVDDRVLMYDSERCFISEYGGCEVDIGKADFLGRFEITTCDFTFYLRSYYIDCLLFDKVELDRRYCVDCNEFVKHRRAIFCIVSCHKIFECEEIDNVSFDMEKLIKDCYGE